MLNIVAPNIFKGDAVGDFCIDIAEALNAKGYPTQIYAKNFTSPAIRDYDNLLADTDTSQQNLLYFHSTHDVNLERLLEIPFSKRLLYYHGITNPKFFKNDPVAYQACLNGIQQIKELQGFDLYFANSDYNCKNFRAFGSYKDLVIDAYPPIQRNMLQPNTVSRHPYPKNRPIKLTSIGRLTPHKKVDDSIKYSALLAQYFTQIDFDIIGPETDIDTTKHINTLIDKANQNVPNLNITYHGFIDRDILHKFVQTADIYITMSEDEGFCIPLYEMVEQKKICVAFWNDSYAEYLRKNDLHLNDKSLIAMKNSALYLKEILSSEEEYETFLDAQETHLLNCRNKIDQSSFLNRIMSNLD